jgi:hypothetical protein
MVEVPNKVLNGPAKTAAIGEVEKETDIEEATVRRVRHSKLYELVIACKKFRKRIYEEITFRLKLGKTQALPADSRGSAFLGV